MSTTAAPSPSLSTVSAPAAAPSLTVPGAVPTARGTTALHFGDPFAEQQRAASGPVLLDRSDTELLTISGAERLSWLEGFVSQHVADLAVGHGADSLILDANGRVEHAFGLVACEQDVICYVEPGHAQALHTFLERMVFWADAQPHLAPELALLTVVGPGTSATLAPFLGDVPPRTLPGLRAMRARVHPAAECVDVVVERAQLAAAWEELLTVTSRPVGAWAWDALRVMDLWPAAADLDEKVIPHEVPAWIGDAAHGGAVHLDKGCYRGQETVARVHNLGRAPRALVRLLLDGSADELPAAGSVVTAGGRTVGRLGTAVHHWELGPVALALVKRTVGAEVTLEVAADASTMAARIDPDSLPGDGAPQAGREAVRRLREG